MKRAFVLMLCVIASAVLRLRADANCLTRYYGNKSEMGSFAPTTCNCPCERYIHADKRSTCLRCHHSRMARSMEPVHVSRDEMQQLGEQERASRKRKRDGSTQAYAKDLAQETKKVMPSTYGLVTGPLNRVSVIGSGPRRLGPADLNPDAQEPCCR